MVKRKAKVWGFESVSSQSEGISVCYFTFVNCPGLEYNGEDLNNTIVLPNPFCEQDKFKVHITQLNADRNTNKLFQPYSTIKSLSQKEAILKFSIYINMAGSSRKCFDFAGDFEPYCVE